MMDANPYFQFGYDDDGPATGAGSSSSSGVSSSPAASSSSDGSPESPPLYVHRNATSIPPPAAQPAASGGNPYAKFGYDDGGGPASAPVPVSPHPGLLSNDPKGDGYVASDLKGSTTAAIKGVGDAIGFAGNLHQGLDYGENWIESKFTGETPEQVGARRQAAFQAARADAASQPGIRGLISAGAQVDTPSDIKGSDISDPILARTGEYVPQTPIGRAAMAGVEAGVGAVGPGMGSVAQSLPAAPFKFLSPTGAGASAGKAMLSATPAMVGSGAASQATTDATGSPIAGLAAGLVTPMGLHAAGEAALQAGSKAIDAVPLTATQREAAAQNTVAGEMQSRVTDPQAAILNLVKGNREIVPGSLGTTAQIAGDPGLARYEKSISNTPAGGAALDQRAVEQNSARQAALGAVQPDGSPFDLSSGLRDQRAATDAATQANVAAVDARTTANAQLADTVGQAKIVAAEKAKQASIEALRGLMPDASPADLAGHFRATQSAIDDAGEARLSAAQGVASQDPLAMRGSQPAADVGAAARSPAAAALVDSKKNLKALYDAVDPGGNMVMPSGPIADAAKSAMSDVSGSAKPMEGEEARLFNVASNYGDQKSFREVTDLRSAISAEMRNARVSGDAQSLRRLTTLRGSVEDAIEHAVENKAALDQIAVHRGTMAPEDAASSRVKVWADDIYGNQQAELAANGRNLGGVSRGGAPSSSRSVGAARQGGEGSRGYANDEGLPPASGRAPQSLVAFLRANGGIKDFGGELRARELQKSFPGLVNNRAGISLDRAREAAAEAGYLGADTTHAVGNTDVNDFLHAIDNHPVYSVHDENALADRADRATFREMQRRYKNAAGKIRDRLAAAGEDPKETSVELLHEAAKGMVDEGLPWHEALDRATDHNVADLQDHARAEQFRASSDQSYNAPSSGDERDGRGQASRAQQGGGSFGNAGPSGGEGRSTEGVPLDAEAAGRLKAASAAKRDQVERFGSGSAGAILKEGGSKGEYAKSDAQVPDAIFRKGNQGAEATQSYLDAGGSHEALFDAAALSARKAAIRPDGTLDSAKLSSWMRDHKEALSAMPEAVSDRFLTSVDTHQAVEDALAARRDSASAFEKLEAGKVARLDHPSDIVGHVGRIIDGGTAPAARMSELAAAAKGNPIAEQGLKRAVVEHIVDKFVPEVGDPRADKLDAYLGARGEVLSKVLAPEDLEKIRAQSADLQSKAAGVDQARTMREVAMRASDADRRTQMKAAEADRSQRMSEFQRGTVGQLVGTQSRGDILNILEGVIKSTTGAAQMQSLADRAAKIPNGSEALKRGVMEAIERDVSSTTLAGNTDVLQMKRAQLATYMAERRDALKAAGLSPAQISKLDAIVRDGAQANRSIELARARGGSDTEPNKQARLEHAGNTSMLNKIAVEASNLSLATTGGYILAGAPGSIAGSTAWLGKNIVGHLREAGLNRVRELRIEAALDPDLGLQLLQKAPKGSDRSALGLLGLRARQHALMASRTSQVADEQQQGAK